MTDFGLAILCAGAAVIIAACDYITRKRRRNTAEAMIIRILGGTLDSRFVYQENGRRLMRRGTEVD